MSTREPTRPLGARVRAVGLSARLVMDDIGTPALAVASMLALISVVELAVVGSALSDELSVGGVFGDAEVQLFLWSGVVSVLMLAGLVLGTWFRSVWTVRALVVLRLLGVVFTLAAAGTASPFAILALLLAVALWVIAEVRWSASRES